MPEYIEREAHCKKCIHYDICDSYSGFDVLTFFPHNEDCEYFRETADVVEVVRCKDCKRCEMCFPCKGFGLEAPPVYVCCFGHRNREVLPNDYCSYGEKMDGKGEGE